MQTPASPQRQTTAAPEAVAMHSTLPAPMPRPRWRHRVAVVLLAVALTACAGRQVVVRNAPRPSPDVFLSVTNRLSQSVNVYIVRESTEGFLRQVRAGTTETIAIPDVAPGTTAQFRARTVDGARTFNHGGAVLQGTIAWEIR